MKTAFALFLYTAIAFVTLQQKKHPAKAGQMRGAGSNASVGAGTHLVKKSFAQPRGADLFAHTPACSPLQGGLCVIFAVTAACGARFYRNRQERL